MRVVRVIRSFSALALIVMFIASTPARAAEQKAAATSTRDAPRSGDEIRIDLEEGLRIQTKDKDYAYKIAGRLQLDSHTYSYPSEGLFSATDEHNQFFDVRRARLELTAKMARYYTGKIAVDFAVEAELKDAYLNLGYFPGAQFRIGQFVYPFSTESLGSSKYQIFAEPSSIGSLVTSGRDRGVMVHGAPNEGRVFYQIGIFNGAGENTPDNNSDVDTAVRLVWSPEEVADESWNVWLGVCFSTGDQRTVDGDAINLKTESKSGRSFFKAELAPDLTYTRRRSSTELTVVNGPLLIKGEYFRAEYDFERAAEIRGGYLIASYFLTGEQHAVDKGLLERQEVDEPFDPEGEGRGAWEVAVRYSVFHAERKFFENDGIYAGWIGLDPASNANAGYTWTVGVNWYPDNMTRVVLDWFRSYSTPLLVAGLDAAGASAKQAESAVLLRFQIEF